MDSLITAKQNKPHGVHNVSNVHHIVACWLFEHWVYT